MKLFGELVSSFKQGWDKPVVTEAGAVVEHHPVQPQPEAPKKVKMSSLPSSLPWSKLVDEKDREEMRHGILDISKVELSDKNREFLTAMIPAAFADDFDLRDYIDLAQTMLKEDHKLNDLRKEVVPSRLAPT